MPRETTSATSTSHGCGPRPPLPRPSFLLLRTPNSAEISASFLYLLPLRLPAPQDKAIKLTSAGLLKALKKQLPFLEHAPVLTEIDFSPVRAAFEEMDAALLNATAKLSVVRVRPRQTAEGPILENGALH